MAVPWVALLYFVKRKVAAARPRVKSSYSSLAP
jgi:hypothetical protein